MLIPSPSWLLRPLLRLCCCGLNFAKERNTIERERRKSKRNSWPFPHHCLLWFLRCHHDIAKGSSEVTTLAIVIFREQLCLFLLISFRSPFELLLLRLSFQVCFTALLSHSLFFLRQVIGAMEDKENTITLGLQLAHQIDYIEHTPLCSIPDKLILRNDSNATSLSGTSESVQLTTEIRRLEADLKKARTMLCAAEDIIIEQRICLSHLTRSEPTRESSRLFAASLALNACALVGVSVLIVRLLTRSSYGD